MIQDIAGQFKLTFHIDQDDESMLRAIFEWVDENQLAYNMTVDDKELILLLSDRNCAIEGTLKWG